jgi:hypothetical protein
MSLFVIYIILLLNDKNLHEAAHKFGPNDQLTIRHHLVSATKQAQNIRSVEPLAIAGNIHYNFSVVVKISDPPKSS